MLDMMARVLIPLALCASPLVHAHMQMLDPSPFRDPHSNRNEPKDYNILTPLAADGSNFACKGYHLNTPWTTVRTYNVGDTYTMKLKGSATHGGGSCQLSLSFDGGQQFKVIKSIMGDCPEKMKYDFTIPEELNKGLSRKTQALFAWTWFNRIGNREMYMNCAVVDIVPKKSKRELGELEGRDAAHANTAAQTALSSYPQLFVANLKKINDCVTKETTDVIFDDPGKAVAYANGDSKSSKPSFKRGECVGTGSMSAGSSSSSSSSGSWTSGDNSGGSKSSGDDGQWHGGSSDDKKSSNKDDGKKQDDDSSDDGGSSGKGCSAAVLADGMWHPECDGSSKNRQQVSNNLVSQKKVQQAMDMNDVKDVATGNAPSGNVENELDTYLKGLYSGQGQKEKREIIVVGEQQDEMAGTTFTPTRFTWPTTMSSRTSSRSSRSRLPSPSRATRPTRRPEPTPPPRPTRRPSPSPPPRPSRRPTSSPRRRPTPRPISSPRRRPSPRPTSSPRRRPSPRPLPSIRPIPIPIPFPPLRPRPSTASRPPRPSRSPARFERTEEGLKPWQHGDKTTEEALRNELEDIAGKDGPNLDSGINKRCAQTKRDAAPCLSPNRWIKRDACSWTCERRGRAVKRASTTTDAAAAGPKPRPRPHKPKPKPKTKKLKNFRNPQMLWVEKQLAQLERAVRKLSSMAGKKFSTRPKPHPSKRQDESMVPGASTFDMFLKYLDRLQDKMIECIRSIAVGAGQPFPLTRTVANTTTNQDSSMTTSEKKKRQLVVPAMAGPLLYKFEPAFDAVSIPDKDAKYEKRNAADEEDPNTQDAETKLEKKQLLIPGVNAPELPSWLTKLSQEIAALVPPLKSKGEENIDYTHAWDAPPGKLGPKPSYSPEIAAILKDYLAGLEKEAKKKAAGKSEATITRETGSAGLVTPTKPLVSSLTHPTPSPNAQDVAAVLPYFLGPGPYIPPGEHVNWPGPFHADSPSSSPTVPPTQQVDNLEKMPMVVDDLGPGSEDAVRKWFADEAAKQAAALKGVGEKKDGKDEVDGKGGM